MPARAGADFGGGSAARDLGVQVGDALEFDVQGVTIAAKVGSLRGWTGSGSGEFFPGFSGRCPGRGAGVGLAVARAGDAEARGKVLRDVAVNTRIFLWWTLDW